MNPLVVALAGVLLSPLAWAQDAKPASRLLTTGSATITLPADRARLVIAFTAKAMKARDATAKLAAPMGAVREALLGLGIPAGSIVVAASSVGPLDDLSGSNRGYSAGGSLAVELSDLAQLGAVIDAAIAAGASGVDETAFLAKDSASARDRALAMAFDQARRDAEALATAASSSLGRLVSVTSERPLGNSLDRDASLQLSGRYLLAPEVSIAVTVRAEWELPAAGKARKP